MHLQLMQHYIDYILCMVGAEAQGSHIGPRIIHCVPGEFVHIQTPVGETNYYRKKQKTMKR